MAADTLVSVGVLLSGIIIAHTGWFIIDPIIGLVIAGIILISTWDLEKTLLSDSRVIKLHHLHIWAISTTQNALTAHVIVNSFDESEDIKHHLRHLLIEKNIQHATFELELPGEHCHANCC